jgi:DNA-binding PadR family transcriptional regulator
MTDPVDREIRLALWKLHILHHAAQRPVYGLWLLEELAEHGHRLSPGTLYPILERMERNGWLRSVAAKRRNGRRNYRIARAGRRVLDQLRAEVNELQRELLAGEGALDEGGETRPAARAASRRAPRRPPGSEGHDDDVVRRGMEARR